MRRQIGWHSWLVNEPSGYARVSTAEHRKHRSDRRANPSAVRPPRGETEKIRAWAIEQGYELSSRGRIPAELEQAYHDAH